MSRNNKPWLPLKPKTSHKCKPCDGTGKIRIKPLWYWGTVKSYLCNKCGGKGYV